MSQENFERRKSSAGLRGRFSWKRRPSYKPSYLWLPAKRDFLVFTEIIAIVEKVCQSFLLGGRKMAMVVAPMPTWILPGHSNQSILFKIGQDGNAMPGKFPFGTRCCRLKRIGWIIIYEAHFYCNAFENCFFPEILISPLLLLWKIKKRTCWTRNNNNNNNRCRVQITQGGKKNSLALRLGKWVFFLSCERGDKYLRLHS